METIPEVIVSAMIGRFDDVLHSSKEVGGTEVTSGWRSKRVDHIAYKKFHVTV